MSLVSTFVKMSDGKFYQDPTIYDQSNNWFLCFDDEEDPELVIHQPKQLSKEDRYKKVEEILELAKINAKIKSHSPSGERIFPDEKFKPAICAFLEIKESIDISLLSINFNSINQNISELHDCVICDFDLKRG